MITTWDDVPLVCSIEQAARVLDRSVRDIHRDLADGCMVPPPMPVIGRARKHQRRQWSKSALMAFLDGGYLVFEQQARRDQRKGQTRHFFGKLSRAS